MVVYKKPQQKENFVVPVKKVDYIPYILIVILLICIYYLYRHKPSSYKFNGNPSFYSVFDF